MAKKRPSVQKRQREQQKRQREFDKAQKAAEKRKRREERAQTPVEPPADEGQLRLVRNDEPGSGQ